jgi:hypothetical protein
MSRAQSHVVGVALMLGVTALALTTILAGLGTVAEGQAARADAARVADGFDEALRPVRTTGPHVGTVAFGEGRLSTERRELSVYRNGSHVATVSVDALVFTTGDRRVAATGGAIVRGRHGNAWFVREPPVLAGEGVLVVGAPLLNASDTAVGGTGRTHLRTNVSHTRSTLGDGTYRVEVETETPSPWARYFEDRGAAVSRADRDGDGIESVVASYPDTRRGYLVTHDMRLEVGDG